MPEIVVGIDLGTTNSLVAICDERGPRIIPGIDGERLLPSVVRVDPATGTGTVGSEARAQAVARPTETVYSIKRLMGKGLAELSGELQHLPYRVLSHDASAADAGVDVEIGGKRFSPQQLSAMVLGELKLRAEAHLRKPVRKAVITVPAYFDDAQRQATRDAGQIAGLEVVRIVNEPTAAALAYGLDQAQDATVAVYDLGGGTFDISILRVEKETVRVLATNGDTHLGGDDFDQEIIRWAREKMAERFGEQFALDAAGQQALRDAAERAKIALNEAEQAEVVLGLPEGREFRSAITRGEFLRRIEPLIGRTLQRCRAALRDAQKTPEQIDRVILVGGATYAEYVRQRVAEFFGKSPYTALHPMEVVALGAAVQGAIIGGGRRDLLLLDIVPLSLGIETVGGAVSKVIFKGTHVPCAAVDTFTTSVDGQTQVKIHVVQGERDLVKDCRSLGQFILEGIPPMPAGLPIVVVRFTVDASGILDVSAVEQRSGTRAAIQVVPSYGLSRREVDQMVRDSLQHAQEDVFEHQLIELENRIRFDTAAVEKSLAIVGEQIDPEYKQELLDIIEGLRQMIGWRNPEAVYRALLYLDRKAARLAELAIAKTLRETTGD